MNLSDLSCNRKQYNKYKDKTLFYVSFQQLQEWSDRWSGMGSDIDGVNEGDYNTPTSLTPTINTAPATLSQAPQLVPPSTPSAPSQTNELPATPPTTRVALQNSWGSVTEKDPRKDSGIRSRRSSIQAQVVLHSSCVT